MTSELATIDVHMVSVLGHDYAKEMNDRDYYKFERELAAGRDASGYGHMPLGQFQWGMWDYKRTGAGSHQDHSAMKVLNPTPHDTIDWAQKAAGGQADWVEPDWWAATQDARETVGRHWDENIASQFPRNKIPVLSKRSYKGMGPKESFKHWWEKRHNEKGKITTKDAKILAEYALGENLPRSAAEEFIKGQKEDISNFTDFKKKFLEEYSRLKKTYAGVKEAGFQERVPWMLWGERVWVGNPGETYMMLARRELGFDTQMVWDKLPDHIFACGNYDPQMRRVFTPADEIDPLQEGRVLQAMQSRLGN